MVDFASAETAEITRVRTPGAVSPTNPTPALSPGSPGSGSAARARGARFQPGTLLGDRYRIVAMLGRGAMGEVYRAEDLRLEQDVALKFFFYEGVDPELVAERVRRLSAEVRLSREVTHPNVCRVHDLTELEVEGPSGERTRLPVLSMEYVVGDDLAALLRKIGRMPSSKTIDIARQLCSGLAAAHAKGIIHRDLKPANILIDAGGVAKITDFGLAGWADDVAESRKAAGTPLYMAPEILLSGGGNEQSDLYSLGLVLHEMLTGKPVFSATSLKDLARKHEEHLLPPSAVVHHADQELEAAIMRCIDRDPHMRPRSALEVIAMLPGGDPLAAALAAGVTPSVATVAGAAGRKRLSMRSIGLLGVALAALLAVVMWLVPKTSLITVLPLEKPPAVLADRAREILASLGYKPSIENSVYHLDVFEEYLDLIEHSDKSLTKWDRLAKPRPGAVDFWYRQFPVEIRPELAEGIVSWDDPRPMGGSISLRLDLLGRLREMRAVPQGAADDLAATDRIAKNETFKPSKDPDPAPVFAAAGLDLAKFKPVAPVRVPQVFADLCLAWEGVYPESPDTKVRLEVAWHEGKVVSVRTLEPDFATTFRDLSPNTPARVRLAMAIESAIRGGCIVLAVVLAWWNVRSKRGDFVGAVRLAIFMGCLTVLSILCRADVLSNSSASAENMRRGSLGVVIAAIESGGFMALWVWVAYFALEPYARRFWPETLIAWSRLLLGRFTDPEVGRSVAIGTVLGCVVLIIFSCQHLCGPWIGYAPMRPMADGVATPSLLHGVRQAAGVVFSHIMESCLFAMGLLLSIVLLRLLLRNRKLAVLAFGVIQVVSWSLWGANNPLVWLFATLNTVIVLFTVIRYGLLALVVGAFTFQVCWTFPLTTDTNAWFFGTGVFGAAIVGVLGLCGLIVAARSPARAELVRAG